MIDRYSLEYYRIFKPQAEANEGCFNCCKCYDGCSWSLSGTPVDGWDAVPTVKTYEGKAKHTYKILWCPEFEPDGSQPKRKYDQTGCEELFYRIAEQAANDYRASMIEMMDMRRTYGTKILKSEKKSYRYRQDIYVMQEVEAYFNAETCERLRGLCQYVPDDDFDEKVLESGV